jgi:hypothetical protein
MRKLPFIAMLLGLCGSLGACGKLDKDDVREFVDSADATARKRFAPEICKLRGKDFTLHLKFQGEDAQLPPAELDLDRKMFCVEAGKFARLRQYRLERKSLEIDLAADRKTARVSAKYTETVPYYPPDTTPRTPDDFNQWSVRESRDESVVGIESGDMVFLRTDADVRESLAWKDTITLPYD